MPTPITFTKIVPLSSVFAATISGPLPKLGQTTSLIFSLHDAGPQTLPDEIEDGDLMEKASWED